MTCIIMIHESRIKYILIKFAKICLQLNLPFLLNNIPTIVKEKLKTYSLQGFCSVCKTLFFTKLPRFMHKAKLLAHSYTHTIRDDIIIMIFSSLLGRIMFDQLI